MSLIWPVRESRYWRTRNSTSPQIFRFEVRNMSSVTWIVPGLDLLEHFLDVRERQPVRRIAEVLAHGLLAEGAFRAEVAHLERFLLGQARRHDLAEQAHQHFVGQGSLVAV